jgi:transcriptional regulator
MFIPNQFKIQDITQVEDFLKKNTFAALVSQVKGRLWATHIPMMLAKNQAGEDILLGHISKANEQWKEIEEQAEVLAIFQGAHTFISSDWYNHQNVSTWNYMVAHVYGKVRIIEGEEMRHAVKTLVDHYEPKHSKGRMENMEEKYVNRELRGIYGVELKITSIETAFKLSQNRDDENYHHIVEKLEERGDDDSRKVAEMMKKIRD